MMGAVLLPMVSGFRVPPLSLMTPFISDPLRSFFSSLLSLYFLLLPSYMSFSTNFQPLFHCTGDVHYDNIYSSYPEPPHTGGEGSFTQWVHCEFVVSFEAIRPVITQQVYGEFF